MDRRNVVRRIRGARWLLPVLLGAVGCGGIEPFRVNEEFAAQIQESREHYRLKPGDRVDVLFPQRTELIEEDLLIPPDGVLMLRVLSGTPVRAGGRTVEEVAEAIEKTQGEGALKVVVKLRMQEPEVVWVAGEVPRPGMVTLRPGMTALDAVLEVGGNLPTGKMRSIILVRRRQDYEYAVRRVDIKHHLDQGLALLPRDCIYVPRTVVANIATFIQQYFANLLPIPGGAWAFVYGAAGSTGIATGASTGG